jgi:hypothetical protein
VLRHLSDDVKARAERKERAIEEIPIMEPGRNPVSEGFSRPASSLSRRVSRFRHNSRQAPSR